MCLNYGKKQSNQYVCCKVILFLIYFPLQICPLKTCNQDVSKATRSFKLGQLIEDSIARIDVLKQYPFGQAYGRGDGASQKQFLGTLLSPYQTK